MLTRDNAEAALASVRAFIQSDGGDLEIVGVEGNSIDVRFTGRCAGCPSASLTLLFGVEAALRERIPTFETLRLV